MSTEKQSSYQPVACSFHDRLEAFATRNMYVRVQYFTDIREFITTDAVIKDFYVLDGAEFMRLNTGEEIRLDRIVRVDDVIAPGYEDIMDFTCDC